MAGIEAFRERLLRGVAVNRGVLPSAGGPGFYAALARIRQLEGHVESVDSSVKPGSAGYGVVGEGTYRATHGGTFDHTLSLE